VPTESGFIAQSTVSLLERAREGVFNVVPSGSTHWHAFAQMIVERLGLGNRVDAIAPADYPTAARRPSYSVLDVSKLAGELGAPPPWQSLLDRCLSRYTLP